MKLSVFMTYGGSLRIWNDSGILERELELYRRHASAGIRTTLVSYGGADEEEFLSTDDGICVLSNRWKFHPRIYGWFVHRLHRSALRGTDIVKTNQLFGALQAERLARALARPLVVRQGYGHYEHRVAEHGSDSREARNALAYERRALRAASAVVFTADGLAERATERHGLQHDKVHVLPNYIVPETWSPMHDLPRESKRAHYVFFGRLTEQKNLVALVRALAGLPVDLTVIGEGPLREKIQQTAQEAGTACRFTGRLSQSDVRDVLASADAFVLPSLYEGHPKSLIEALAFGVPVIATRSPGIEELLADKPFATLSETDEDSLRNAILGHLALPKEEVRRRAVMAREWALASWSVDAIAAREHDLLTDVLEHAGA